jgi:hypothetical protein
MTVDPGLTPEQQACTREFEDLTRRGTTGTYLCELPVGHDGRCGVPRLGKAGEGRQRRTPDRQASDITDEELAELEEQWPFINADGPLVRRLIAALRASREQLALVRSERDTARAEAAREYDRAEDSRAEVERLEALLDDEGIDPNTC